MFNTEQLQEKWQPVLEHKNLPKIDDAYRRAVTSLILENQEKAIKEDNKFLSEAAPTNSGYAPSSGNVQGYDPILISLVRRAMPNLIAYDIAGVQPMTGPTGLIFAMRSRFTNQTGTEAFYNEADNDFSGGNTQMQGTNPAVLNDGDGSTNYVSGVAMTTAAAEELGDGSSNFSQMAFSIEKHSVTARSRALKAEYSMELAQDLKAIHGLDAETELSNILSSEILSEINREVVRTVYISAKPGAAAGTVSTAGQFDMDVDSNGRWSVEKFKGLMFQLEREANHIAQETRRGKGNMIICSADVASALQMAGVLDYTPALNNNLTVDDTGNTFAGVLNGRHKVYIDPYAANSGDANQYFVSGYKGASPFDAGIFYCPYVPLQMVRAVGEQSFQPKIGFKTRYGMTANPFAEGTNAGGGALNNGANVYYRRVLVKNLM
tara:strand:- start:2604 stop:3908 length:1305 start_codon:yes stop_codon:yes gene_type:complete